MFTGIVQAVGRVGHIREAPDHRKVVLEAPAEFGESLTPGASVAVDGACLTVAEVVDGGIRVDIVRATLDRTIAGSYRVGGRVNLEGALKMGEGIDGHLVQGHIDGIGDLIQVRDQGAGVTMQFRVPSEVHQQTLLHGSIALNGVSLTVQELAEDDTVEVAIIPHTRLHTNLVDLRPGDLVNVEGDLIGKYVGKWVRSWAGKPDANGQEGHHAL